MDKYIKRIQSKLSRQGLTLTKQTIRATYTELVIDYDAPTDDEIVAISQKLIEQCSALTATQPSQMTSKQPENLTEASTSSEIASASNQPVALSQATIQASLQEAIEQQFGSETQATKTALLNHIAKDTFTNAQELQAGLSKIRAMNLEMLMKVLGDFNSQSSSDSQLLKQALQDAALVRKQETDDFFASFENQMQEMRAAFGI